MKPTIDITMVASLRPDVVRKTLTSLKKNLIYDGKFRLIFTVAPTGQTEYTQHDLIKIIQPFFNKNITRISNSLSQAEAQKWVWQKSKSDFVLQWEDDWVLLEPLKIKNLFNILNSDTAAMFFFDVKRKTIVGKAQRYKSFFKKVQPNIYLRTGNQTFGGPPALVSQKFIQQSLTRLEDNERFDRTANKPDNQKFLQGYNFYVYTSPHNSRGIVADIGRKWMTKINMKKNRKLKYGSWSLKSA